MAGIIQFPATFSRSTFVKRLGMTLDVNYFLLKLKGMHLDLASNQKKTYRLLQEWKHQVIYTSYRFEQIEKMKSESPNKLTMMLLGVTASLISSIGGGEKWDSLDAASHQPFLTEMMETLALSLGEAVLTLLPADEKCSIELFFWARCSMHKELNSVKGSNVVMMKWWANNGVPPPVLLANNDNAATIQLAELVEASDAAVKHALDVSSCGGIKAASVAGAIFNPPRSKAKQKEKSVNFQTQAIHDTILTVMLLWSSSNTWII
jgi:hypothetical protein